MNRERCSFGYSKYISFVHGDSEKHAYMKRKMEDINKNQLELLGIKNLISEMKNALHGINNRFSSVEEIISKFEDIGIEINTK